MRHACADCEVELRPKKTGAYIVEMADFGPYKLWACDIWECPICKCEIATGIPNNALGEHWQRDFEEKIQKLRDAGQTVIEVR